MGLRYVEVFIPGSEMALFGLPAGGAVAILGLLCFERDLRAVWPVLVLNIMTTMAMQARATWLGLGLGVLVWGLLTRRFGRVVAMGMAGLAVLGIIELGGIQLGTKSGAFSLSREVLSIAIAPIDIELAKELSPRRAITKSNTSEWRHKWWEQIWLSVHSDPMFQAFGLRYGFDLFALAPEEVRAGQAEEIRTPHSVFYYAPGYTGWVGVALFAALQLAILKLLWRAFRADGQPAGVVFWVMGISMACFEESFETPYKAIPFYLLVGMAMAPALQWKGELHARPARAQLLSVAGR
jgi:O-Antigen ligase